MANQAVNDLPSARMSDHAGDRPRPYAGEQVTTVEIRGQPFRVADPNNKQFYRDLTCLEDDELIAKYGLVPCSAKDYHNGRRVSTDSGKSSGSSMPS
jgi:hypothetical protein